MYKFLVAGALTFAASGCTTTEEATRQRVETWKGRPVRDFAEHHSLTPEGVHNTPTGRAFVFRRYGPYGSCGITILGVTAQGRDEYVIGTVISDCGPAAF